MKKIFLIVSILIINLGFSQELDGKFIKDNSISASKIIGGVGGGTSNPNITIVTSVAEINAVAAGGIAEVQQDIDAASGTISPNNNVTISLVGGDVTDIGSVVGDDTSFFFINENQVFDISGATVSGTFKGGNQNASNFGLVADDITDNRNALKQGLFITNYCGTDFILNPQDTNIYKIQATDVKTEIIPFYPTRYSDLPYVSGGNLRIPKGVTLEKIPDNLEKTSLVGFYDCDGSKIYGGGTIKGDRYEHDYQVSYHVTAAPSSGTYVTLQILEIDEQLDNIVTKTILENISVSTGSLATIKSEILAAINGGNAAFDDYTATLVSGDEFRINGVAGQYFRPTLTAGDTDLTDGLGNDIYAVQYTHEDGYLITVGSVADNVIIDGLTLRESTGEALIANFQGNGDSAITAFTRANIDFDTGVITDSGSGSYMYADDLRDITGYPHPWAYLIQNSFASTLSLYPTYRIMWYDASNVFIESTPVLQMFRRINFEPEWKKARLVFDYTPNESSFNWYFDSKSVPLGGVLSNCNLIENRRQSISNPQPDLQIINNRFTKVGGAAPNYHIDWEDNGKLSTDGLVFGNTFDGTGAGALIMKGNIGTKVVNNVFEAPVNDKFSKTAIATAWSRNILIQGNTFNERSNAYGIGTLVNSNHNDGGEIIISAGGGRISNEFFLNTTIRDGEDTGVLTDAPEASTPIVSNSTFAYNREWLPYYANLIREYGTIGWENVTFAFNDKASMHYTTGVTFPLVELSGSIVNNSWHARKTITNDGEHNGYYKDFTITGLTPVDTERHSAAAEFYAHGGIDGLKSSVNISIRYGYPVDGVEYKDIKVKGWLNLGLDQYPSTNGGGDYDTIYVINPNIEIPVETASDEGYLDNTNYGGNEWTTAFRTPAKDVNIVVIGGIIRSLGDVTGYILKAEQYGTLDFIGTRFISDAATAETIDLTDTTFVPATTGDISFENCKFYGYSATPVTLRAGDTNN